LAEEDLGARTYNHDFQVFGEFCKFLVLTGRLTTNPVARLDVLNAATDVRHKPRALAPEEVERLMASARSRGEVIQGYDGETRARIYVFSFLTDLRRQEMGSLPPLELRTRLGATDRHGRGRLFQAPSQRRPAASPGPHRTSARMTA